VLVEVQELSLRQQRERKESAPSPAPERANLPKVQRMATGPTGVEPVQRLDESKDQPLRCVLENCAARDIDTTKEWAEVVCSNGCVAVCHKSCLRAFRRSAKQKCPIANCDGAVYKKQDVYMDSSSAVEKRARRQLPPRSDAGPKEGGVSVREERDERPAPSNGLQVSAVVLDDTDKPKVDGAGNRSIMEVPSAASTRRPKSSARSRRGTAISLKINDKAFAPRFAKDVVDNNPVGDGSGTAKPLGTGSDCTSVSKGSVMRALETILAEQAPGHRAMHLSEVARILSGIEYRGILYWIETNYRSIAEFCKSENAVFALDYMFFGSKQDPALTLVRQSPERPRVLSQTSEATVSDFQGEEVNVSRILHDYPSLVQEGQVEAFPRLLDVPLQGLTGGRSDQVVGLPFDGDPGRLFSKLRNLKTSPKSEDTGSPECIMCCLETAEVEFLPCRDKAYCRECALHIFEHAIKNGKPYVLCPLYDQQVVEDIQLGKPQ